MKTAPPTSVMSSASLAGGSLWRLLILLCLLGMGVACRAQAQNQNESRLALVIGNSNYARSALANPVNDARLMAKVLADVGFEVIKGENVSVKENRQLLRQFGEKLRQRGGVGLFYFAGHGVQIKGKNYLVSVDSDIQNEDEVPDYAIEAQSVLAKMDEANNRVNLVILDACRDNPFVKKSRSSSAGLAQMDAPSGTLVAFSTSAGSTASDGAGANGMYTAHLARILREPGLTVEEVFKQVRTSVRKESNGQQVPSEFTALEGQFFFRPPLQAPVAQVPGATSEAPRPAGGEGLELGFWDTVKNSGSVEELQSYVTRFPQGVFVGIARARIASLRASSEKPNVPAPPAAVVASPATPRPVVPTPGPATTTPAVAAAPVVAVPPQPSVAGEIVAGNTRYIGRFSQDADARTVSGTGRVLWSNGDSFEGALVAGKRQGKGKFSWKDGQYDGDWIDDRAQGSAAITFGNGNQYVGAVADGLPNGEGAMKYASGDTFRGSFTHGLPNGSGVFDWVSGQRYEGDWRMDKPQGMGVLRFANGNQYEGAVADGVPNGQGSLRYASGDSYKGTFKNGVPDGRGVFVWKNGDQYSGPWKDGVKEGDGVFVWSSGDRWEGTFRNDVQTDAGKLVRK